MIETIKLLLSGMIIGVANVIPGVSGGTMAVILNIYDRLVSAVSFKNLKNNLLFLFKIALGAGAGILLFSTAVKLCLERFPMQTNFTFMGLIIGSIPMIYRRAAGSSAKKGPQKIRIPGLIAFILALGAMLSMGLADRSAFSQSVQTVLTLPLAIQLFFGGALSAFAMILPGISGSFIMLLLGVYGTVIAAISSLNIWILLPMAAGCCIGLLAGAKLVAVLLGKFPQQTYCAILGLIAGSLVSIFPGFTVSLGGAVSVLLLLLAAAATWWFSVQSK